LSYALVGIHDCYLFVQKEKVPDIIYRQLTDQGITILPYPKVSDILKEIPQSSKILLHPGTINCWLYHSIPEQIDIVEGISIPTRMKAIKNEQEIFHIRNVMVKDGIALTRFFIWLEKNLGCERITELTASEKLTGFRADQENFQGPSFATISAYNAHGASPHYEPTPESDIELKKEGIYLLDSGGQYLDGTTDVTRTIALGEPTSRQKSDFTLALKGTINLAMAEFPLGTKGYQIEVLARKALWDNGLNYGHGTGHGVGFFLNVHEGPQTIGTGASGNMNIILEPGMLTADEPAIYREGEYGIRTENLILCVKGKETNYGQFLKFETVTLCFIDSSLVEKSLLTDREIQWFNQYHEMVYNRLSPHLNEAEKQWLKDKTKPV
jgi:Xaa-Pro aminopeptidase